MTCLLIYYEKSKHVLEPQNMLDVENIRHYVCLLPSIKSLGGIYELLRWEIQMPDRKTSVTGVGKWRGLGEDQARSTSLPWLTLILHICLFISAVVASLSCNNTER